MKYLKKFESFYNTGWQSIIEGNSHYEQIVYVIENEPKAKPLFEILQSGLRKGQIVEIEPIFYDFDTASELLVKELTTYRFESFQNIDTRQMAVQAFKYIAGLGVLAALVKLFYVVGRFIFENLDEMGVGSVAGGVLVVLLYLAVFGGKIRGIKKPQNVNDKKPTKPTDDYLDYEEL